MTQKQRQEIYRIQTRVQEQIDKLRQKITDLEAARSLEVDAVLSDEQLDQVKKKRAAAEQRRRDRRRPVEEKQPSSSAE